MRRVRSRALRISKDWRDEFDFRSGRDLVIHLIAASLCKSTNRMCPPRVTSNMRNLF